MNEEHVFDYIKSKAFDWATSDWAEGNVDGVMLVYDWPYDTVIDKITHEDYFGGLNECKDFFDLEMWYYTVSGNDGSEVQGYFGSWLNLILGIKLNNHND